MITTLRQKRLGAIGQDSGTRLPPRHIIPTAAMGKGKSNAVSSRRSIRAGPTAKCAHSNDGESLGNTAEAAIAKGGLDNMVSLEKFCTQASIRFGSLGPRGPEQILFCKDRRPSGPDHCRGQA